MPKPNQKFCAQQVQRMLCLRDASFRFEAAYEPLWRQLHKLAATEAEAETAITLLIEDQDRASDKQRNGVPEPGELAAWVSAAREKLQAPPQGPPLCGNCRNGWIEKKFTARGQEYNGVKRCPCQLTK